VHRDALGTQGDGQNQNREVEHGGCEDHRDHGTVGRELRGRDSTGDRQRTTPQTLVKGVTYHRLEFERGEEGAWPTLVAIDAVVIDGYQRRDAAVKEVHLDDPLGDEAVGLGQVDQLAQPLGEQGRISLADSTTLPVSSRSR
jgi:hypothetical protein